MLQTLRGFEAKPRARHQVVCPLDCQPLSEDVLFSARLLGAHWFMSLSVTRGLDMAVAGSWQVSECAGLQVMEPRVGSGYGVCPRSPLSLPAASPAVRGLPCRVGALPQRRARPTSLLRPRRAAGLQAVAARPDQLPQVGGEPQRRGPGARRVWVCAQILRGTPPPPCSPPEYPKMRYQRDFRPRQLRGEGRKRKRGM